jgi:hypothetical protein
LLSLPPGIAYASFSGISINDVSTTDATNQFDVSFARGDLVGIEVRVSNNGSSDVFGLVAVSILDIADVPIVSTAMNSLVQAGETTSVRLEVEIPIWAFVGEATVYANFNDPSNAFSLCEEGLAQILIEEENDSSSNQCGSFNVNVLIYPVLVQALSAIQGFPFRTCLSVLSGDNSADFFANSTLVFEGTINVKNSNPVCYVPISASALSFGAYLLTASINGNTNHLCSFKVTSISDLDWNLKVNVDDIAIFLSAYMSYFQLGIVDPSVDFNMDGKMNIEDTTIFMSGYIDYYSNHAS